MSLREKINEQYNSALKNKNKNLISTLKAGFYFLGIKKMQQFHKKMKIN